MTGQGISIGSTFERRHGPISQKLRRIGGPWQDLSIGRIGRMLVFVVDVELPAGLAVGLSI